MSSAVFPTLLGASFPSPRSAVWDTTVQTAISGKETRIARQTYPRWKWDLSFSVLRSGAGFTEFQQIVGLFNKLQGQFDTFLFADPDDNAVTGQALGIGDGSTKTFQLVRAFGAGGFSFIEPMLAPNVVSHVYNNGIDSGGWSVSNWGSTTPGVITYVTAPAAGHAITADFSYYWPCRFNMDSADFSLFLNQYYELKKLSIISVKN